MQKIEINLRKKRAGYDGRAITLLLVAVSVIWSLYSINVFIGNRESLLLHERSIQGLEEKLKEEGRVPEAGKDLGRDVELMNSVITRRAFSWSGLLDSLEEKVPPGVSLVRITPDFTGGTIKLAGLAREMKDILSFVEGLEGSPDFEEAFLLKHSDRDGIILFEASAVYTAAKNL